MDDSEHQLTISTQKPTDVVVPTPPTVTGAGEVTLQPPDIVEPLAGPAVNSVARELRSEEPPYPAAARRLGAEGMVLVRVLVGIDAHAQQVELAGSSGSPRLDDAALRSVRVVFRLTG